MNVVESLSGILTDSYCLNVKLLIGFCWCFNVAPLYIFPYFNSVIKTSGITLNVILYRFLKILIVNYLTKSSSFPFYDWLTKMTVNNPGVVFRGQDLVTMFQRYFIMLMASSRSGRCSSDLGKVWHCLHTIQKLTSRWHQVTAELSIRSQGHQRLLCFQMRVCYFNATFVPQKHLTEMYAD